MKEIKTTNLEDFINENKVKENMSKEFYINEYVESTNESLRCYGVEDMIFGTYHLNCIQYAIHLKNQFVKEYNISEWCKMIDNKIRYDLD